MIEIKITDPHLMDKDVFRKTVTYLLGLIDNEKVDSAPVVLPNIPPVNLGSTAGQETINTEGFFNFQGTSSNLNKTTVELDVNGLPWDHRIHSRTKSKTANGAWKLMRGIPTDAVTKVESELQQAVNAPAPDVLRETIVPPPPANDDPLHYTKLENPPANDFNTLMKKITEALAINKLTRDEVLVIVKNFGLPSLTVVPTRPELIPLIIADIDNLLRKRA